MVCGALVLAEQLFPQLHEVEKQAEVIMAGLLEKNPASDKETDPMAQVGHMNLLRGMVEENSG